MESIYFLKKSNLKAILISILVSFHLFFWDIKFANVYGFRETICFVHLFIIYDLCKNNFLLLKNNKKNLLIISLFSLLIFIHQYANSYFDQTQLKIHNIFGILGLYLMLLLVYFYYKLILINLKFIIIFFLSILFLSYFISDLKLTSTWEIENLCSAKFHFVNKHIFAENSHFGMMFGAVVGYLIYYYKNINILLFFLLFAAIFSIMFLEASTTLYFSFLLSLIIIFILDSKFAIKKILISFAIFATIFSLLNPKLNCFVKIKDTVVASNVLIKEKTKIKEEIFSKGLERIKKDKVVIINKLFNKNIHYSKLPTKQFPTLFNLSTAVFVNSLNIAYETLKGRPLGWGLNRYENAFDYYMFGNIVTPYFYHEVYTLNYNDGSSNFSKIITEFGWFSFLLIPIFFSFLFTKKMSTINKIFFLVLVGTQLVRGAGFFSGGFIFALIIILFTVFNFYEKNYEE